MIEEILHVPYYHPSEGWFFGKPITENEAESPCRQMGIPFRRPDPKDRAIAYLFSTPVAGTEYVECLMLGDQLVGGLGYRHRHLTWSNGLTVYR